MSIKTNFLVISVILSSIFSYAQEIPKFKLHPNGIEPIIFKVPNLGIQDIQEATHNWYLANQEEYQLSVVESKSDAETVYYRGNLAKGWSYSQLGVKVFHDMDFTLRVDFKDAKYRLSINIGKFTETLTGNEVKDLENFYKREGYVTLLESLNKLSISLNKTITNYSKSQKKEQKEQAETESW